MADEEDAVREQLIDSGDAESGETGDDNGKPIGNAAFGKPKAEATPSNCTVNKDYISIFKNI